MYNLDKTRWLGASFFLYVLALLSWGCANTQIEKTEPHPDETVAEFPKMEVGDRWTVDSAWGIRHYEIVKVDSNGGFIFEVRDKESGTKWHSYYDNQYRLVNELNVKTKKVEKPLDIRKYLDFPLFVGKKWKDVSHSSYGYEKINKYKVLNLEWINTKVGRLEAFKIRRNGYYRDFGMSDATEYYWYSPKIKRITGNKWRGNVISFRVATDKTSPPSVEYSQSNHAKKVKKSKITKKETTQKIDQEIKHSEQRYSERSITISVRWACVIGISRYKDTRIPSLRYASKDAQAFYNWLISTDGGQYAPSRVKLLIDEQATGDSIKQSLFEWLGQALEEDMVTIFFAGHGSPQSPDNSENLFLLPYDVKYDSVATTGFPMWDIETALKRFIKAKKVIVIADACHAGGVGKFFDIARRAGGGINMVPISSNLQNLSKIADGICIISASDDSQYSQESKKWGGGHGVFTYYLLKGLNGDADYNRNRLVSLGEIIPYLSEQVRRATKNAQTPTVAGRFDPALSIGK